MEDANDPVCACPGCSTAVAAVGMPCDDCVELFGPYMVRVELDVDVMSEQLASELALRDREVAAAYARNGKIEAAASANGTDPECRQAVITLSRRRIERPKLPGTTTAVTAPEIVDRRRNQRCWLCEERHTCTKRPNGWECDNCASVV